jgi:hypothetical protein
MTEVYNRDDIKNVVCFEQRVYDAVVSRGVKVHWKDMLKEDSRGEKVCVKRYVYDRPFYAYCHWLRQLIEGYCTRDIFVNICSHDNLSRFFCESDLNIPLNDFDKVQEKKIEKPIPQQIKDDVNAAARKKDAHALIGKYFPQTVGV